MSEERFWRNYFYRVSLVKKVLMANKEKEQKAKPKVDAKEQNPEEKKETEPQQSSSNAVPEEPKNIKASKDKAEPIEKDKDSSPQGCFKYFKIEF